MRPGKYSASPTVRRSVGLVLLDHVLSANQREENPGAALLLQLATFYPDLQVHTVAGDAAFGYDITLHVVYAHVHARRVIDLRAHQTDRNKALWPVRGYDDKGYPLWDTNKFPSGMKALGDYLHARGLKFGIYSRAGWVRGHETQFAERFAEWGVDLVKYDFSNKQQQKATLDAIRASGRDVLFSVCEWGRERPWLWAPGFNAEMWRTTYDVKDKWTSKYDNNGGIGVLRSAHQNEALGPFVGPGRWNDTPFWVFQVPREISAGHGDISSPLLDRLLKDLLDLNEVFDPELELRISGGSDVPDRVEGSTLEESEGLGTLLE